MVALRMVSAAVYVRDRKAAMAWYVEKLGARVVADEPQHWTTVRFGGRGPELHLCEHGSGRRLPKADVGVSGLLFTVDGDFRKGCAALAKSGVKFSQKPTKSPWGWIAAIRDPDGNEYSLAPAA